MTHEESVGVLKPSHIELALVMLTGVIHVDLELIWIRFGDPSRHMIAQPHIVFNAAAALGWGSYVIWRMRRAPGIAREWGFRLDTLVPALRSALACTAVATLPMFAYGAATGKFPLPPLFWAVLLVYPVWGLAQQFALQVLVGRNLRKLVPSLMFRAVAASAIFGAAHIPNWKLAGLTFLAGTFLLPVYEKLRNIWAVGLAHGILGALAWFLVVGVEY